MGRRPKKLADIIESIFGVSADGWIFRQAAQHRQHDIGFEGAVDPGQVTQTRRGHGAYRIIAVLREAQTVRLYPAPIGVMERYGDQRGADRLAPARGKCRRRLLAGYRRDIVKARHSTLPYPSASGSRRKSGWPYSTAAPSSASTAATRAR